MLLWLIWWSTCCLPDLKSLKLSLPLLTRLTHSLSSPSSGIKSHSWADLFHAVRYLWDCLMNYAMWWCVFLGQCEPFPEGLWKTGLECVAAVSSRGPAGLVHASDTQVRLVSQKHPVAGFKNECYSHWWWRLHWWMHPLSSSNWCHKSVMGTCAARLATTF